MSNDMVRGLIALFVLGIFVLITGSMALYPLFSETNVDLAAYSDYFAKTASIYTGIVGVIIGYYFGRAQERKGKKNSGPDDDNKKENLREK